MKAIITNFTSIYNHIIAAILPPTCLVCESMLAANESRGLCSHCWAKLPFWNKNEVAIPLISNEIDGFSAPFLYEEPISNLVKRMKFKDSQEIAKTLARYMVSHLPDAENPVLIPVPMHYKRLWWRQFNQSVEIAKALSLLTNIPYDLTSLKRIKATSPQVGKSASSRKKNLTGAFFAGNNVVGQDIILVDDVWTTGSTAAFCAKSLKRSGAKSVTVISIAYVNPC